MIWITYILPPLILVIFGLSKVAVNNHLIIALLSSTFLFCTNYFANFKKSRKFAINIAIAVVYFFIYDVIFTYTFGVNVVSFCFASLFFLRIRKHYSSDVSLAVYNIFGVFFFLLQNMINYLINSVFYIDLLLAEIIIFTAISAVYKYFFDSNSNGNVF